MATERNMLSELSEFLKSQTERFFTTSELSERTGINEHTVSSILNRHRGLFERRPRTQKLGTAGKPPFEYKLKPGTFNSASIETTRSIQPPGSIIMPSAANYVRKKNDQSLEELLGEGYPFRIYVLGPPQSGKSSLMAHIPRFAQETKTEICNIDLRTMDRMVDLVDYKSLLRAILIRLRQVGRESSSVATSAPVDYVDNSVIEMELKGAVGRTPGLIIRIDSLDLLYRSLTESDMNNFLNLLVGWTELGAKDEVFRGLSLAIAVTPAVGRMDANTLTPLGNRCNRVNMDYFERKELEELASILGIKDTSVTKKDLEEVASKLGIEDASIIGIVEKMFAGQPYLTHLFLNELRLGRPIQNVVGDVLSLAGAFGKHWQRMRLEILNYPILELKGDRWGLLRKIAKSDENEIAGFPLHFTDCISELRLTEILDGHFEISCEFYKNAVLRETGVSS